MKARAIERAILEELRGIRASLERMEADRAKDIPDLTKFMEEARTSWKESLERNRRRDREEKEDKQVAIPKGTGFRKPEA